ncbi:hypothetical protein ABH944_007794 [Caballeronia udeis]|uniref:Uncharacterized protein n=1 Tax=Caballeronia udeis TaxID=1232866 RepID=A0ABW8MUR7_9BURK
MGRRETGVEDQFSLSKTLRVLPHGRMDTGIARARFPLSVHKKKPVTPVWRYTGNPPVAAVEMDFEIPGSLTQQRGA